MERKDSILALKETESVQKKIIGELILAENLHDILTISYVYILNYLPLLQFSLKHMQHFELVNIMNTSITIDRIMKIKLDELIERQTHANVMDFSGITNIKDGSKLTLLYLKLSSVQKYTHTINIMTLFSMIRDIMFQYQTKNRMYLNYGIGWTNMLNHFVKAPGFAYTIRDKDINILEKEINRIKKMILGKNRKLDKEIIEIILKYNLLDENEANNMKISYIGLKIDWLEAKSLLNYIKYLKTNNNIYIKKAIHYVNVLLDTLDSDIIYDSNYMRERLEYPGPDIRVDTILQKYNDYMANMVLNYGVLFHKNKTEAEFVLFPTSIEFYLSKNIKDNNDVSLLKNHDFIIRLHKEGIKLIFGIRDKLVSPIDSEYAIRMREYKKYLLKLSEFGLAQAFLENQMKAGNTTEALENALKASESSEIIVTILTTCIMATISAYGEARGWSNQTLYANQLMPIVSKLITSKIIKSKIYKILRDTMQESEDMNSWVEEEDEYESYEELKANMQEIDETSSELIDYMSTKGVLEVQDVTENIRNIVMTSETVETAINKIKEFYKDDL